MTDTDCAIEEAKAADQPPLEPAAIERLHASAFT